VSVGHVDFPPPGTRLDHDEIVLSGWVAFADGPAARVEAWLGETHLGRARLGLPRPDVAAVHPGPDAAVSGFELRTGLAGGGRGGGEESLRVVAVSTGGERKEFEPIPVIRGAAPPPRPLQAPRRAQQRRGGGRRVLAFTNVLSLGGAAFYLLQLLREAQRQGRVEATVVAAIDGPLRGELEAIGIPVHLLGPVPLDDVDPYLDRIEELAAWAAPGDFELVFVNTVNGLTLPGADLAERLGIPAVWAIHESFHSAMRWDNLAPELRRRGEAALGRAAIGVFCTETTRQLYADSIGARSVVTPYGIDMAPIEAVRGDLDRERARRELGVPAGADLAICVGTVEPRKAQIPLAQAFELVAERHPNAQIAFVGADEQPASLALADRVASSPQRERMRIVPRTTEVQPWYGVADLLVCASDIEALPITVLEAMVWETPVLATAVFGLPEVIEHGVTGWLCEPGDVSALAAGLETALSSDRDSRRRIGAAARELVVERHDLGLHAGRIADLFDLAAGGGEEISP